MPQFHKGMKIVHRAQSGWGVGHVLAVSDDPPRLSAQFPGRPEGAVLLSSRDAALARFRFAPGATAVLRDGTIAKVLRPLPGPPDELYRYTIEAAGKKPSIHSEADLRAPAPREGPAEQLASGRWGAPEDFHLRSEAVRLDLLRRADALGALFASRVYVKPHQVSVANRVLSAPQPRFVLADEVGLGKTIEAGLVLSGLLQAGLVKRCLVVAPSHLTVQWLAELFHKFNLLFTLMDPDRAREDREAAEAEADDSQGPPWSRHSLVITSLEFLSRSQAEAKAAASSGWDLVIVDEAHHLRGARAYEVAQALSQRTWGLLLLTATPLQLDPAEYHALLRLVDPAPAATEAELRQRLSRQAALSAEVRALLAGDAAAAARIALLFPEDPQLRNLSGSALLAHLSESYGLSARLLRNRRAVVGGFTRRVLTRIDFQPAGEERALEEEIRATLPRMKLPSGAVLASLFRRLGSSPPSLAAGLSAAGEKMLAQRALALPHDSKLSAFLSLVDQTAPEKLLVFAEARETVEYLRAALARRGIEALAYVGELSPAERDKLVARFRDPEGPRVLLSTELGGEGRNFQHCHVLVNYDLSWSPSAIEQRIGRIDRIGQSREVRIVAFRPAGTLEGRVLEVLEQGVGVFTEPVGGLDPVLEKVESELLELAATAEAAEWSRKTAQIAQRVSAARTEMARAYDPLLDLRSCDPQELLRLAERGARRLGARLPPAEDAGAALQHVAALLEKRLESVTIEAAKRIGMAVDVEVDVLPGQVSFQVGPELKVDALAGFDLSQDRIVLGSFRREVAVRYEEHDSFATGHPLIEALFGWVRDGELGRATVARARVRSVSGAAFDARFVVALPEPSDLAQGARVPSRRAARHLEDLLLRVVVRLDGRGGARADDALAIQLDSAHLEGVAAPEGGPPGAFVEAMELGLSAAQAEAQRRLQKVVEAARERLDAERDGALRKLSRWLSQSHAKAAEAQRAIAAEAKVYDDAAAALGKARIELDQAALIQLA